MKLALISDIHGNLHALRSVLQDAKNHSVDTYAFLGDFIGEFPFPNEVMDIVSSYQNAYVINGNKEQYIKDLFGKDQTAWIDEQFAPIYWNFNALSEESRELIKRLPNKMTAAINNAAFYLAHSPAGHFDRSAADRTGCTEYAEHTKEAAARQLDYSAFMGDFLSNDRDFIEKASLLPGGIYAFGHFHTQWHARVGDKLLVNPGSCGLPLDHKNTAPYTIIEYNGPAAHVHERRVEYDVEMAVHELLQSRLYSVSPVWGNMTVYQARTGEPQGLSFLKFVQKLATSRNDSRRPYSNAVWHEAAGLFCDGLFLHRE